MDKFIRKYGRQVSGINARTLKRLGVEIKKFLGAHNFGDFVSDADFARRLIDRLKRARVGVWGEAKSLAAIQAVTAEIYKFYRLVDETPFGQKSPVKLRLGGPDKRSLKFFNKTDQFYFERIGADHDRNLTKFFRRQYLEKGAAIFGDKSPKELDDFRRAAGDKVAKLNDRQVKTIIHTSVQRIRVWAHIGSLSQGRIKEARVVAIIDERTTEICKTLNGKRLMVGVAQKAIEKLNGLSPAEFGKEMYEGRIGRAIKKYEEEFYKRFVKKNRIEDRLVRTGRGIPPYHPNCRTRLKALY